MTKAGRVLLAAALALERSEGSRRRRKDLRIRETARSAAQRCSTILAPRVAMQGSSIRQTEDAARAAAGPQPALSPGLRPKEVGEVGEVRVLFVHRDAGHLRNFQEIVARHPVGLGQARDLREASQAIAGAQPPHVVFTDTKLPDGDWQDVLALALKASEAVNVVVVSAVGNISLYLEAVERGAFDLLTPNIAPRDFPLLLQAAAQDAVARRASGPSSSH